MNNRNFAFLVTVALLATFSAPAFSGDLDNVWIVMEKRVSNRVDPSPMWFGSQQVTPRQLLDNAAIGISSRLGVQGANVREVGDFDFGSDPVGLMRDYFAREIEAAIPPA